MTTRAQLMAELTLSIETQLDGLHVEEQLLILESITDKIEDKEVLVAEEYGAALADLDPSPDKT